MQEIEKRIIEIEAKLDGVVGDLAELEKKREQQSIINNRQDIDIKELSTKMDDLIKKISSLVSKVERQEKFLWGIMMSALIIIVEAILRSIK